MATVDEDSTTELSYEECLHIVEGLEYVRKSKLAESPIVELAARLMQENKIRHLPSLNQFIEDLASNNVLRHLVYNLNPDN
jgi:ribosomal protein L31E